MHEYAAIDPIALLFPSRLYIELSEKLQPQVPTSTEIKHALGRLTPEERLYILRRARMLLSYSKAGAGGRGQRPSRCGGTWARTREGIERSCKIRHPRFQRRRATNRPQKIVPDEAANKAAYLDEPKMLQRDQARRHAPAVGSP